MASKLINVGVIGCGHWGPNHIRVFSQLSDSQVLMCADPDKERLTAIQKTFPSVDVAVDHKDIFNNPSIDAVCIAVPTNFHFSLTKEALECGKHVL